MLQAAIDPSCALAPDVMSPDSCANQKLLQRYRASLPHKHKELASHWQRLASDPDDALALTALQQMLHRLAGSAGAYGYAAIGDLARDADALIILRRDPLCADEPPATFVARLEPSVRRLLGQLALELH